MTTPGTFDQSAPLIEVLSFDGCPNHQALLLHLRRLLEQAGVNGDVRLVEVPDDAAAQRLHFLSSPTVRINGRDVDPATADPAADRQDYVLQCRLHDHDGHRTGTPPQPASPGRSDSLSAARPGLRRRRSLPGCCYLGQPSLTVLPPRARAATRRTTPDELVPHPAAWRHRRVTILLGLPVGRLRRPAPGLRVFLNATTVGVLVFLTWDVLSAAWEPIDAALAAVHDDTGTLAPVAGYGLLFAAGLSVGLLSLVGYERWMSRRSKALTQRFGPGAIAVGELPARRAGLAT